MSGNCQLGRECNKLDLARHAIVEQNLRAPAASEIAEVDIQV